MLAETNSLCNSLYEEYIQLDWKLFTDSSQLSLKAVLHNDDNFFLSIPVGHAVNMKVSWEYEITSKSDQGWRSLMTDMWKSESYSDTSAYSWSTQSMLFLCEWDNHIRASHYKRKCGIKEAYYLEIKLSNTILLLIQKKKWLCSQKCMHQACIKDQAWKEDEQRQRCV